MSCSFAKMNCVGILSVKLATLRLCHDDEILGVNCKFNEQLIFVYNSRGAVCKLHRGMIYLWNSHMIEQWDLKLHAFLVWSLI